jgi:hypothetical protein
MVLFADVFQHRVHRGHREEQKRSERETSGSLWGDEAEIHFLTG